MTMSTPTLNLPAFPGHAYGVNVSHIGEERDMIAHGHVEPRRFVAACNRWHRETCGRRVNRVRIDDHGQETVSTAVRSILDGDGDTVITSIGEHSFRDTYSDLIANVRHCWAIRQPKCDCPEEQVLERGCDDHDPDPDPDAWWISRKGVTADTPGAFPITLGLWS